MNVAIPGAGAMTAGLAEQFSRERLLARSPIRRAAKPEDIAALVLFLASDQASIVTVAAYPIDGARTAP